MILFAFFAGVLLYRCFNLQIVNGEEYLNDFILQIEKTRDISSTRGRILDRNGNVLAENELAYSVRMCLSPAGIRTQRSMTLSIG